MLYELAEWAAKCWVQGELGKARRIYGVLMRKGYPHPMGSDYWDGVINRKVGYFRLGGK